MKMGLAKIVYSILTNERIVVSDLQLIVVTIFLWYIFFIVIFLSIIVKLFHLKNEASH